MRSSSRNGRPERRAASLPRLRLDQPVDDIAALHQQKVQRRVDAIDLDSEICEGLETGRRGHDRGARGFARLS